MPRIAAGRPVSLLTAALLASSLATTARGAASAPADLPPAVVALVLDTSGSVAEPGIKRARDLSSQILAGLPPASEVAVFTFDDESRLIVAGTSQADDVRTALEKVRLSGHRTALYDALYDASRYLTQSQAARRAIVLITDGQDTGSAVNVDDGLRLATTSGIPIFPVGVGAVNERVLRRIAKLTAGEYLATTAATGESIASKIAALPPRPAAAEIATPAPPRPAAPASAPPFRAGDPREPVSRTTSGSRGMTWLGLALAALVPMAGVALVILRRRSRPRCPACGTMLAGPDADCGTCPPRDRVIDADLSPTVLARLSSTEEYLDKTITLRERPVLAVTRGPATGQIYDLSLQSATSLGRAKVNDIIIPDVAVSSEHCRVRPEDGRFVLHDLKSTNGTFVNDRRVVSRHNLIEGDVIKVGETSLQFRTEQRRT